MNCIKNIGKFCAAAAIISGLTTQAQAADEAAENPWNFKIELGLTGQSGNSQTMDTNAKFGAIRQSDKNTLQFGLAYYLETSDGDKTANQFKITAQYDEPVDQTWSWYIAGRYDIDEFKSWDERISVNGGLGYKFDLGKHEAAMDLTGKFGLGARQEFDDTNDRLITEASFGLIYDWEISKTQTFAAQTMVYPDISDKLGESRIVSEASWSIKLDTAKGLSLKFGIENEYESSTIGNAKHSDLKGTIGLVYEF